MVGPRIKRFAASVSSALGGIGGASLAILLLLLDWLGRLAIAAELIALPMTPDLLLLPAAALLAGNVMYNQWRRAEKAEGNAAKLRAALDAKPDPNAITRMFLFLHDEAAKVAFGTKVPYEDGYIEQGEARVKDWLADCSALIGRAAALGHHRTGLPCVRADD